MAAVLLGAALGVVAGAGADPADPVLGFAALGALVAAPGVLALLGLRDRSDLWLSAGLTSFPLAFLSFAGLTLPLLPLAVIFAVAWIRHPGRPRSAVRSGAVVALVVILLVGAAVALFISEDPASWTTATGGGSTSDIVTNREALLSLACTMLALVAGWTLTRPRRISG